MTWIHCDIPISESVICYNHSCQTRHKTRNLKLRGKTFQLVPKIKPQSRFTARKITKKSMCYYVLVITMVRSSHFFFKTNSLFVSKDCFTRPCAVHLFNWKIIKKIIYVQIFKIFCFVTIVLSMNIFARLYCIVFIWIHCIYVHFKRLKLVFKLSKIRTC